MEDIESLGLLKMDFLGLRNLTMIEKTINLVEKSIGKRLDPDSFLLQMKKHSNYFPGVI